MSVRKKKPLFSEIYKMVKNVNASILFNSVSNIFKSISFLISNNIKFVNYNAEYNRISLYDIPPTLKEALYKIGYFYIENLNNIDLNITDLKSFNGIFPKIADNIIDFAIKENFKNFTII